MHHRDSKMNRLFVYSSRPMDCNWDDLRLLLLLRSQPSLRSAAEAAGLSQPTLGRRLQRLEESIGESLLIRTTQGISWTDAGKRALASAERLEHEVLSLGRAVESGRVEIRGRVRLSVTDGVASTIVPPALKLLASRHPNVAVDLSIGAHRADIGKREADIAIRMFRPEGLDLIAKKIGETGTSLYASRDYLSEHGRPESLEDLPQHRCVGPDRVPFFVEAARSMGMDPSALPYRCDSGTATLALVRGGVAVGAVLDLVGERDPHLVRLFGRLIPHPIYLVTHPDLRESPVVRALWNALEDSLA